MEEGLSSEHGGELLSDTLEHLLDGGRVSEESDGHLESLGGDITEGRLDVVGNPLNEVRGVLVLELSLCSSTSLVDMRPLKRAEAVRYLPCLGSEAHIMFLASNICWVSSGTVRALYCWEPLEVRGANPVMKKWRRGKGMRLTASFLRSELSCPGNLRQQVTPERAAETRWF